MDDLMLLYILTGLLLLCAVLRLGLSRKKGQRWNALFLVTSFFTPAAVLAATVAFQLGRDYVFPVILLCLIWELFWRVLRSRSKKREEDL